MTDKQMIIDGVDISECEWYSSTYFKPCNGCKDEPNCYYKQLQREKQNSQEAIDTSIREFNRAEELKTLLKRKEQECEELRRRITKIFACLIKANRNEITDTLWVDDITTLWDYIALTLGIEGDQAQIEEQVLQKISENDW